MRPRISLPSSTQRGKGARTCKLKNEPGRTRIRSERRPWLIALAATAAVVVIGVLVVISNLGGSSDVVDTPVEVGGANPIQVVNDQESRATITFAGDAQALVDGGAHIVDIQMEIEANTNSPGISLNLVSTDGVITTTGMTDAGDSFTPTWAWTPDGDKVVITMVGRGVSIPDTRPSVVVSVQGTASSEPVEFVLTAASGARPGGSG